MGTYDEIERFVAMHRGCGGKITGKIDTPTADGYAVNVTCACGKVLSRYVTPEIAREDLIFSTLLCSPN